MQKVLKYSLLLFRTQVKRMVLCMMVVLLLAAGLVVASNITNVTNITKEGLLRIGVFVAPEDTLFPRVIEMISEEESISRLCSFEIRANQEQAPEDCMKSGELQMAIVVPGDFMVNAMSMKPAQITMMVHADSIIAERKVLALVEAVQQIIAVTESSILSVGQAIPDLRGYEDDIMLRFVSCFMRREEVYEVHFVSAFGGYSFVQYYAVAFLLILLIAVSGCFLGDYRREQTSVERMMIGNAVGIGNQLGNFLISVVRITGMSLAIFVFEIAILISAKLAARILSTLYMSSSYMSASHMLTAYISVSYVALLLVAFSVAVLTHLFASITLYSPYRYTIYYLSMGCMIVGAGLAGSVYYLPGILRQIAGVWPMRQWQGLLLATFFEQKEMGQIVPEICAAILVTDMILMVAASVIYSRKARRT